MSRLCCNSSAQILQLLKCFQLLIAIVTSVFPIRAFNTPAENFFGTVDIVFIVASVLSLIEIFLILVIFPWMKIKLSNTSWRFILAILMAVVGVALLYKTISLDQNGTPRCAVTTLTERGHKGHRTTTVVVKDQPACQLFQDKVAISILALVSSFMYCIASQNCLEDCVSNKSTAVHLVPPAHPIVNKQRHAPFENQQNNVYLNQASYPGQQFISMHSGLRQEANVAYTPQAYNPTTTPNISTLSNNYHSPAVDIPPPLPPSSVKYSYF